MTPPMLAAPGLDPRSASRGSLGTGDFTLNEHEAWSGALDWPVRTLEGLLSRPLCFPVAADG